MRKNLTWLMALLAVGVVFAAGCASKPKPTATPDEQMAALEGWDIPLDPLTEGIAFGEPTEEDALILRPIYFDFDKSEIRDDGRLVLEDIAAWMLERPEAQLKIEGHCDERGTKEYNLALGERRALSVRSNLTGLNVNPQRLHTISYGEEMPVCPEATEECWSQNRRAEFLVNYGGEAAAAQVAPPAPEEAILEYEEIVVIEEPVELPAEEDTGTTGRRGRSIDRYHQ
ncbi:MAG: peptidoglycan-associated lipoprotein Pal [Candidatus Erginobacter occultus]|nr:peptidoglycan-associated lipoprotein Pal [Candidatus Erginobacter occultus]